MIDIRPVQDRATARAFLALPAALGGEAAGWSVPLEFDTKRFFDAGFNGFLETHAVARFIACRQGRVVGRIATALRRDGTGIGSFGFLALQQDPAVLHALLGAAAGWLQAHGAARLRGPLSLSINHEVGAQVSGFDQPGMVRLPRTPRWLPAMLEAAGLVAEKDVLSKTLEVASETHCARFGQLLARWPGRHDLRLRPLDWRHYTADIALATSLFNDAWADNWAAEPVGAAEAATIARLMRPLLRVGLLAFAEWQGRPVGVISAIPNLEEATEGLGGKLLPFGWWPVARLLAGGRTRAGRVPMLGISTGLRGHPASAMAKGLLFQAAIATARQRGWQSLDLAWLLEDNHRMLAFADRLGAVATGRWRVYGAALPA